MSVEEPQPAVPKPKLHWYQFSVRHLLLLLLLASLFLAEFTRERRWDSRRREAFAVIEAANPQTTGGADAAWPWYSRWLHRLVGDHDPLGELHFVVFGNFSSVDDNTLTAISQFQELGQLWLCDGPEITDTGLRQPEGLTALRDLDLENSRLSPTAVEELRRSLPACKITWEPKRRTDDQPSAGEHAAAAEWVAAW